MKKVVQIGLLVLLSRLQPMINPGEATAAEVPACYAARQADQVELGSPFFVFRLDAGKTLRALSWENRLTGRKTSLGSGLELELDLDAAQQRISITGWRCALSQATDSPPEEDRGFREGFASPKLDDSAWPWLMSPPWNGPGSTNGFDWARARVSIPAQAKDKSISLTVGGFGLFDYRFLRVFLNGQEVGRRLAPTRWREPLVIELGPGSAGYGQVCFGQENVIALQMSGFVSRLPRLDELDPRHARQQAMRPVWPAQFEQYLTIGKPCHPTIGNRSHPGGIFLTN